MANQLPRRAFLAASAASVVGGAEPEIRAAMVGVGSRGTQLLRQVLEQQNVKVTAICDIDAQARDRAQGLAQRDNPKSFTDYRRVLELADVDAVVVATPCDLHAEMAAACLEAGKHVYCEKPLGVTPEQVALALRAARRSQAVFQIGQQLRYFPSMREAMRRLHEERVAGEIFAVKAQRHATPVEPGQQRPRPEWYLDIRRSGDLIVENAVHNLDACNWIVGSRPVSASGDGGTYLPRRVPAGRQFMDGFSVQYTYENGIHVAYSQYVFHPRGLAKLPNGQWYAIFGEKGAVWLTHEDAFFHPMHERGEPVGLIPDAIKQTPENAMSEFFACIREKRQPFAGIEVAAVAALTAIMGREAIYQKRQVTWKELGVAV
jgi:myo-inositol 2-dehydrogenase/D-chiro-inositol 1-dehydrogenase